jgi:hypothetical protein
MGKPAEHVFRVLILFCMGCMAITAVVIATDPLRRYMELSKGTLVYYVISLAGGGVLALGFFTALRFPSSLHKVSVGGLLTILALGINQIVGLRLGTILCFTPS